MPSSLYDWYSISDNALTHPPPAAPVSPESLAAEKAAQEAILAQFENVQVAPVQVGWVADTYQANANLADAGAPGPQSDPAFHINPNYLSFAINPNYASFDCPPGYTMPSLITTKGRTKKPAKKEERVLPQRGDAPPATRVSLFGGHYSESTEDQWSFKEGAGWIHEEEAQAFANAYKRCCISKLFFPSNEMVRTWDQLLASEQEATKAGWKPCALTGYYCPPEDLVIKVMDGDGRWVHVSRKYVENNDISFPKCDVTGHPHLKAGTMAIYGSSKYKRVGMSSVNKSGLFSACGCCGNLWEKEMVKVYEEIGSTPLCTLCMMKELIGKIIHPFNHKDYPKPIYTKQFRMGHTVDKKGLVCATNQKSEVQATRLFGWEAETEIDKKSAIAKGVNRAVIAMAVRDTLGKDYVCMKEDGTLTMNGKYSDDRGDGRMYAGFEIVSAPADMEAHRTRIAKLPETAGYKMLRAFDTETCGFHVHVSRASLTSLQIGRMLYTINHKNWARFVHKVACRGSARFCAYYDKKLTDALHPERVISKEEEGSYNKSRRVALNIANKDTVEFRIFKGTVNPRHIMRNIEFCDAICDFCLPCERSLKDLADYREFIKFVDQNRKKWPMLAEWFAYQKMISVKKIKKGIDPSKLTIRPDLIEEADVDKQEPKKEQDPPF